jgi:hypothetical protein
MSSQDLEKLLLANALAFAVLSAAAAFILMTR